MSQLPASLAADLQSLNPGNLVEFFVLDCTNIPGGGVLRFHAGTNSIKQSLTWQGNVYAPLPLTSDGFASGTRGALPRPTLTIANTDGVIGALIRPLDDLVGATVTRKQTLVKYLDAVNFGGYNPDANPNVFLPDEVWVVERKVSEDYEAIVFELSASIDLDGVMLPGRPIQANSCWWQYRSAECSYTGGAVAKIDDTPTAILGEDNCSRRVSGCKLRFPNATLPFGGFTGAGLLQG